MVIAVALQRLSNAVRRSSLQFSEVGQRSVRDIEVAYSATTEVRNDTKPQIGIVSVAKSSASDALKDVTSLWRIVAVSDRCEAELFL